PSAPTSSPRVISPWVGEQSPYALTSLWSGRGITQPTEGQGEVGLVSSHAREQVLNERRIALALREEAKLAPQAGVVSRLELRPKGGERLFSRDQCGLCVSFLLLQNGQQRLSQTLH